MHDLATVYSCGCREIGITSVRITSPRNIHPHNSGQEHIRTSDLSVQGSHSYALLYSFEFFIS